MPFQEICQLFCTGLKIPQISISFANSFRPMLLASQGLAVDLVIWNEDHAGYRQLLHDQDYGSHRCRQRNQYLQISPEYFRPASRTISDEDRILIMTVARHYHRHPWFSCRPDQRSHSARFKCATAYPHQNQSSEPLPDAPAPAMIWLSITVWEDSLPMAGYLLPPPELSKLPRPG